MMACLGRSEDILALVEEDARTLPEEEQISLAVELRWSGCSVANHNGPTQVVLSGLKSSIDRVLEKGRQSRAIRRAIPLEVSAPFHSPVMRSSELGFEKVLQAELDRQSINSGTDKRAEDLHPLPASVPVISNISGLPLPADAVFSGQQPQELRHHLVAHISHPVRWSECVQYCQKHFQPTQWIEFGPKAVLSTLVKNQLGKDVSSISVTGLAS